MRSLQRGYKIQVTYVMYKQQLNNRCQLPIATLIVAIGNEIPL